MNTYELVLANENKVMASIDAPSEELAKNYFRDKLWPIGYHNGRLFEVREILRVRYV